MFENIVLNQTRSSDPKGMFGMHQGMLLDSTTNKILAFYCSLIPSKTIYSTLVNKS